MNDTFKQLHGKTFVKMINLIAALNFGVCFTAQPYEILKKCGELTNFDPNNSLIVSLLSGAMILGGLLGSITVSLYVDRLGYHRTIFIYSVSQLVVNLLYIIPIHWFYLFVLRFMQGFLACNMLSMAPLYAGPKLNIHERETNVALFGVFVNIGVFLGYLQHLFISYNYKFWALMILPSETLCLIQASFLYLLKEDQKVTLVGNQVTVITNDYQNVQSVSIDNNKTKQQSVLTKYQMLRLITITLCIGSMQVLTGMDGVFIYSSKILSKAFSSQKSGIYSSLLVGFFNALTNALAVPILKIGKRKLLLTVGVSGVAACHLCIGLVFLIKQNDKLLLFLIILFLCFLNTGPQPIMLILFQQIFPTQVRTRFNSLGFTANWTANFCIVFAFDFFAEKNQYVIYWICGALTLATGYIGTYFLPETLHRSLDDIEQEVLAWCPKGEKIVQLQDQTDNLLKEAKETEY